MTWRRYASFGGHCVEGRGESRRICGCNIEERWGGGCGCDINWQGIGGFYFLHGMEENLRPRAHWGERFKRERERLGKSVHVLERLRNMAGYLGCKEVNGEVASFLLVGVACKSLQLARLPVAIIFYM